jgi:flagellar protein FlaF
VNAINLARTAYSSSAAPIRSTRSTEYDAIAQITHRLKSAAALGKDRFSVLVSTLHENRRLWVLFAGDVASKDNLLPDTLRAQLFYLAEFTLQHTSKVLDGTASVDVLIEINTAVMRGLRQQEIAA